MFEIMIITGLFIIGALLEQIQHNQKEQIKQTKLLLEELKK